MAGARPARTGGATRSAAPGERVGTSAQRGPWCAQLLAPQHAGRTAGTLNTWVTGGGRTALRPRRPQAARDNHPGQGLRLRAPASRRPRRTRRWKRATGTLPMAAVVPPGQAACQRKRKHLHTDTAETEEAGIEAARSPPDRSGERSSTNARVLSPAGVPPSLKAVRLRKAGVVVTETHASGERG